MPESLPEIEIANLVWRPAGAAAPTLDLRGYSVHVRGGETLLISGASGAGKSTLAAACAGLLGTLVPGELQGTLYELFWTSYLGYRVIETDRFTLDLQAGFRLVSMGLELELTPGTSPGLSRYYDRTWIDPVVGLRTRTYLTDWLFVPLRGDVGGFGANSQFTWQAFAGLGVQISRWAALIAGYRTLGYNYDQANFEYNVNTHGPLLGFEISF